MPHSQPSFRITHTALLSPLQWSSCRVLLSQVITQRRLGWIHGFLNGLLCRLSVRDRRKGLNAYMPGLADSTPVPNPLVFGSANSGRVLYAFLPTVANSRYFIQPGGYESTAAAEQDSCPRSNGPFLTECGTLGSSTMAPRHRLVRPLAPSRLGTRCFHSIFGLQGSQ